MIDSYEQVTAEAAEPEAAPRIEVGPLRPRRIIGKATVCEVTGKTYPTIWAWMRDGKFPRSRVLPSGGIGWFSDEVADFLDSLPVQALKGDADATERMTALASASVAKRKADAEALERKAQAVTRAPRGRGRRKRKHA